MDVRLGPPRQEFSVTVTINTDVSNAFDMGGYRLSHVRFPATMTQATMTLESSPDAGTTWLPVGGFSISTTVSTYVPATDDADYRSTGGLRYVRLKFPGNEAAARTIGVVLTQAEG